MEIQKKNNNSVPNDYNNSVKNNDISSQKVSEVSYLSPTKAVDPLVELKDSIHRRSPHSDIWICDNCSWTGDIHFMKIHPCKYNKKGDSK